MPVYPDVSELMGCSAVAPPQPSDEPESERICDDGCQTKESTREDVASVTRVLKETRKWSIVAVTSALANGSA